MTTTTSKPNLWVLTPNHPSIGNKLYNPEKLEKKLATYFPNGYFRMTLHTTDTNEFSNLYRLYYDKKPFDCEPNPNAEWLVKHIEGLPARGNFVIVKLCRTRIPERLKLGLRPWVETFVAMRGATPNDFVEILKDNDL